MLQLSSYKYANGAFVVVTLIFLITCTSSSSWREVYYSDSDDYSINGLWRVCEIGKDNKECGQYYPGRWIDASRTLMIIAAICSAGSVLYTIGVYITVGDPDDMKLWRCAIMCVVTAFFTMVGMSVYTANEPIGKMPGSQGERGFAFAFGWSSMVLALISAFTSMVADKR